MPHGGISPHPMFLILPKFVERSEYLTSKDL